MSTVIWWGAELQASWKESKQGPHFIRSTYKTACSRARSASRPPYHSDLLSVRSPSVIILLWRPKSTGFTKQRRVCFCFLKMPHFSNYVWFCFVLIISEHETKAVEKKYVITMSKFLSRNCLKNVGYPSQWARRDCPVPHSVSWRLTITKGLRDNILKTHRSYQ